MWVFRQIEKGLKAHTTFHAFLKSGQGLQLQQNKCYFKDFQNFKETIIRTFYTKLRDPIAVIESSIKRIKLTLSGVDWPTTPTTLEVFCNTLDFFLTKRPPMRRAPRGNICLGFVSASPSKWKHTCLNGR